MNWISVKDKLPAQGQTVLAWLKEGHLTAEWGCAVAEFAIEPQEGVEFPMWHPKPAASGSTHKVTHWQPLPEPPVGAPH